MEELLARQADLQHQIKVARDEYLKAVIVDELNLVTNQIAEKRFEQEREGIQTMQAEHNGGLKELIYQILESVFDVETGQKLYGLNEYSEMSQSFRQMIDVAVDDHTNTLNAFIAEQLESKDGKIRELTTKGIEISTQLQELQRKTENYDRIVAQNEELEHKLVTLENDIEAKDRTIAEQAEQLRSKDEQIAKLTGELNAPKPSGIILPNQAKPSQTLAEMMDQAKQKGRTALELALAGERFRGKITINPSTPNENNWIPETEVPGQDSFRSEDSPAIAENSGIPVAQEVLTPPPFQDEISDAHNTVGGNPFNTAVETVTRAEFEALRERVFVLERNQDIGHTFKDPAAEEVA